MYQIHCRDQTSNLELVNKKINNCQSNSSKIICRNRTCNLSSLVEIKLGLVQENQKKSGSQAVVKGMALDSLRDSWQAPLLNYEGPAPHVQTLSPPNYHLISIIFSWFSLLLVSNFVQFCHHTLLSLYDENIVFSILSIICKY